jgi:hypothetical protein
MSQLISDPRWWATLAETPLLLLLAWMVYLMRREQRGPSLPERAAPTERDREETGLARTRDDLASFKLEVARTYVPLSLIRDVDQRLTQQLMRIEQKLDEAHRAATVAHTVAHGPLRGLRIEEGRL